MSSKRSTGEDVPMNVKYMKNLRFYQSLIGAWPYKEFGSKTPIFFSFINIKVLFVIWSIMCLSGISYLKNNFGILEYEELGHTYITVFMNIAHLQRLTMAMSKTYKTTVVEFVIKIHLVHHKDTNEYSLKVYKQVEKISRYWSMIVQNQATVAILIYNALPVINNYRKGNYSSNKNVTLEHGIYYDLPFDYTSSVNWGYLLVTFINFVMSCDSTIAFIDLELMLFIIVFHLWGHLKILRYNLSTCPNPEMQERGSRSYENTPWFNDEENKKITELLKINIQHHRLIQDFMAKVSSTYGLSLCVYLVFYMASESILLLESTRLDANAMLQYIPLAIAFNQQLIQSSVVMEILRTASEVIKDVTYSMPWECMNTKNRKILLIFSANLQTPMTIKAMGLVSIGVETMAGVMKTTFSYFMLLRTFTTEEQ